MEIVGLVNQSKEAIVQTGPVPAPAQSTACSPEIRKATATEFEMVNPSKPSNFIVGELTGGELDFVVENLPKTHPFAGCPGSWMFQQMMLHFGANVTGIRGNWIGPNSDNLAAVNRLTAGGAVRLEEAAKQTWTGIRAGQYGFLQAEVVGTPTGSAGHYTQVRVLFKKQ